MKEKKLSDRVRQIVDLVPNCECLADVGCDHANISIFLKEIGRVERVIASDLREGPLQRAKENVEKKNLLESFQFRLCNGLSGYKMDEVDGCLISGLGGILMSSILEEGREVVNRTSFLVLEPQSDAHLVRKWLRETGFSITKESFVKEGSKYYPVIRAERTGEIMEANTIEEKFGPLLLKEKNETLRQFLMARREILNQRREAEEPSFERKGGVNERLAFFDKELQAIEKALEYYEDDIRKDKT